MLHRAIALRQIGTVKCQVKFIYDIKKQIILYTANNRIKIITNKRQRVLEIDFSVLNLSQAPTLKNSI